MGALIEQQPSTMAKVQLYLNAVNHVIIGVVAFYTLWLAWQIPASMFVTHMWTCTLGYNVLMCESFMALYNRNSWSNLHVRRTKNNIHWILQAIGCTLAFVGMCILYVERGFRIKSIHAILGFTSNILIIIGVINGSSALWSAEIRRYLKPLYVKLFHNLTGMLCFITGMASLIYGFQKGTFSNHSTPETVLAMQCFCGITIVLSLIGACKSFCSQLVATFPFLERLTGKKDDDEV